MAHSLPSRDFQPLDEACEDNLEEVLEHNAEAEHNAAQADDVEPAASRPAPPRSPSGGLRSHTLDVEVAEIELSDRSSTASRNTFDLSAEGYQRGQFAGSICRGRQVPGFQSCQTSRSGLHAQEDPLNMWSVNFSWFTLCEEYLVHLAGPFSYPYLCWAHTKHYADNHDLLRLWGRGTVGAWSFLFFCGIIFLWASFGTSSSVSMAELLLPILIYLARNSIIACKYAYLSPHQIEERKRRYLPTEEVMYQLVLSGWKDLPRVLQRSELDHSFTRLAIDDTSVKSYATFVGLDRAAVIEQLKLNVPDEDIPPEHPEWLEQRNKGRLHVRLLCDRFVSDSANSIRYPYITKAVFLLAIVHCLIPTFLRAYWGKPVFGSNWHETFAIILCIGLSFPNFVASLLFVLVGLLDYKRRIFLMHRCSGLLVDSYLTDETARSTFPHVMPLLNFSRANNVAIWLETRQIFKDFGLQWFKRVQAYSSFWVFSCVWMLGFLFYQIIFTHTAEPTAIFMICFDLITVVLTLFSMLVAAKKLNSQHVEHRQILLKKLTEMQRHISLLTKTDPASLAYSQSISAAKKMVKVTIQSIETDDELSPVKILGFAANDGLVRALITAAGSGLVAAGKVLWDM